MKKKLRSAAWVATLGASALTVLTLVPSTAGASNASHSLNQHGTHGSRGSGGGGGGNLINHGGPVLSTSDVYVIWWGTQSSWDKTAIRAFFQGLNKSTYVKTADQYTSPETVNFTAITDEATDPTTPPSSIRFTSTIGAEVQREVNAHALPADPKGVYFVYTSNFPSRVNYCAWHSTTSITGAGTVAFAYMPNTAGISGCDPVAAGGTSTGTSYPDSLSLTNVTAHEFMESITDTQLTAWYDSSGSEIGDKCAWMFSGTVTLANSTTWLLQEEWSNSAGGCVETTTTP
jgi:hypothetical protein